MHSTGTPGCLNHKNTIVEGTEIIARPLTNQILDLSGTVIFQPLLCDRKQRDTKGLVWPNGEVGGEGKQRQSLTESVAQGYCLLATELSEKLCGKKIWLLFSLSLNATVRDLNMLVFLSLSNSRTEMGWRTHARPPLNAAHGPFMVKGGHRC